MITSRCPHDKDTPVGGLCGRCEQEGVGLVELDADGEGIATFLVPVSQGLKPEDYEALLSKEDLDEALVRRKLMRDEEVEKAMLRPYKEDPEAAEEDAYEDELAWKLTERLIDLVGNEWRRAALGDEPCDLSSPAFPSRGVYDANLTGHASTPSKG